MTHVRAARPEDYDDFVRLYREISLGEPAAEQRSWDGLHCRQARMAVEGDRVVGYLRYELFDDFAYVHHLSVAPEARRRGVGLKLMRHAAGEIRAHGIRRWMLHVLAHNAAAQALYALLGLERAGRSTTLSVSFDALERASGDVSALSVGPLPAERDAEVERLFHFSPRRLTRARENPDCRVFALMQPDAAPLGVALHAPKLAWTHPLSVLRPDLAIPPLAGLRTACQKDSMRVGVDDDADVEAALLRAGASVTHRSLLYRGELG